MGERTFCGFYATVMKKRHKVMFVFLDPRSEIHFKYLHARDVWVRRLHKVVQNKPYFMGII